jgi:transcription-repair coupling factor (superfamily II helicase)
LAALQQVRGQADQGSPPIVVVSARALMQKTLPARELRLALRTLKTGSAVRLDQMIAGWVQTGYNPVEIVEEPGVFARRGGIVDIWPPNLSSPVRIDLFGDEVESLRLFDPATQRTIRQVAVVEIGPGSEVLSKYGPAVLERLNVRGEGLMAPENVAPSGDDSQLDSPLHDPRLLLALREELRLEVEHLRNSQSFHGIEWYLPYAYAQPASLLDHVGTDGLIIVDDPLDLFATLNELEQQAEGLRVELERSGELPRGFQRNYFTADELRKVLLERKPATLGYGDLYGKAASANTSLARSFAPGPRFGGKTKEIAAAIVKAHNSGHSSVLLSRQTARLRELLQEFHLVPQVLDQLVVPPPAGSVSLLQGLLGEGFVVRGLSAPLHFYTDTELFGWSKPQARSRSKHHSKVAPELFFADMKSGEFVVHIEHGIGMFDGLVRMELAGIEREYLQVSYARGDKLYVPVHQADRLSRYVGAGESTPPVTRLGTADWQMVKDRAKRAVAEIAEDLLKLYAQRELIKGHVYSPDSPWQEEMEAAFPYQETDDQLHAVEAVKRDMESERPMDRLVCGDVGYGKTEVAIRAAFKAINDGKQVAFLVPTTVLAQQHYRNISNRLNRFPVRVEVLSRFRTAAQQDKVIDGLRAGSVDLVVGTHRLLSQDVEFKDLGMLIIDEEQRFGVAQKEQLKQLRA